MIRRAGDFPARPFSKAAAGSPSGAVTRMDDESKTSPLILVVEDADGIAAALEFAVRRAGYRHARVADGAEALPRIRVLRPDLVLLDVMLPGMSGYDICREVRAEAGIALTRILFLTARGSARERAQAMALGADGFVSKPFEMQALLAEVRRLLVTLP
jgi:two-component system, OmpR family, phosphate regulon response regulator PhoB